LSECAENMINILGGEISSLFIVLCYKGALILVHISDHEIASNLVHPI